MAAKSPGVCTPCPEGMRIKERDLKTGTTEKYYRMCRVEPWRQEEVGPIPRAGTTYHDHTVLLREAHSTPHDVTAQMALVDDMVSHACETDSKTSQRKSPPLYTPRPGIALDICFS